MITTNDILTAEKQKTISVKRTFNLPLNSLWKAFTEPESFKKWWGPKDYTCPHSSIDFKEGGKYLNCMRAADGKEFWSTGTYKEIIPLKKIVCTDSFADSKGNVVPASDYKMPGEWELALLVTLEFEGVDGKTNLSLKHEGIPAEIYDECVLSWQQSLDKLESNVK
jgi:uncharacterized protein YndB with AHSA1/START domain